MTILLAFPSTGLAQDAGTGDAGGCGMVTFEGECNGNVVVFCDTDNDTVEMIDCVADVDPNAICTEISPTYGVDCALAVGDPCVDEDGNIFFCQGTAPGCFEDPTGAVCTENIGPCVAADVDTCRGEEWIFECSENQPYVVDCGAYGGRCDDRPGRCFDLPAGSFCGESFECATGLTCGPLGLCVMAQFPDAGTQGADAGTAAPRDGGTAVTPPMKQPAEDSGCNASGGSTAMGLVFGLLALAILRRQK